MYKLLKIKDAINNEVKKRKEWETLRLTIGNNFWKIKFGLLEKLYGKDFLMSDGNLSEKEIEMFRNKSFEAFFLTRFEFEKENAIRNELQDAMKKFEKSRNRWINKLKKINKFFLKIIITIKTIKKNRKNLNKRLISVKFFEKSYEIINRAKKLFEKNKNLFDKTT